MTVRAMPRLRYHDYRLDHSSYWWGHTAFEFRPLAGVAASVAVNGVSVADVVGAGFQKCLHAVVWTAAMIFVALSRTEKEQERRSTAGAASFLQLSEVYRWSRTALCAVIQMKDMIEASLNLFGAQSWNLGQSY